MKRLAIFLVLIGLFPTLAATQVSGLAVSSKPSKPAVTLITSKTGSARGKVNVTVTFTRASTNSRSPLLLTQVKIGKASCSAVRNSTKCTVKNLKSGERTKVTVRAKNRNGYGSWSSAVSFVPKPGAKWVLKAPTSPTTLPSGSATVPGGTTTSALKFDFSGAAGIALQEISTSTASTSSVSKFAVTNSNLLGITKNGEVFDAVKSGTIKVKNFLIAPNDTLYLHSESTRVNGSDCVLVAVSIKTGIPDCVEADYSFLFTDGSTDFNGTTLPGVTFYQQFQFDDLGGIAYTGIPSSDLKTGFGYSESQSTEVRYYRSGKKFVVRPTNPFPKTFVSDFRNPVKNFLLLKNGSLLVEETDFPTQDRTPDNCRGCQSEFHLVHYFPDGRRVLVAGFPTEVARTSPLSFMTRLPDGRVIVGAQYGWLEIDTDTDLVNSRAYLSWSSPLQFRWGGSPQTPYGNLLGQPPLFNPESSGCPALDDLFLELTRTDISKIAYPSDGYKSGQTPENVYLTNICYDLARHWRKTWFADNRLVVLASRHYNKRLIGEDKFGALLEVEYQGLLVQVYPTFKPIVTSITSVNAAQPFLNSVILTGEDANGANKTVLYDIVSGVETTLISGLEDLRIRSFTMNAGENSVFFGARRLSNNKSVIGKVNMTTKEVSILKEMPAALLNIQMFSAASN